MEERAERPHAVHLVDGRRIREGELRDHEEPRGGDHLALRGARALERERREYIGRDERFEHHDLLLLECGEEGAPPLSDEVDNVSHGGRSGGEGRGDRGVTRTHHRQPRARLRLSGELLQALARVVHVAVDRVEAAALGCHLALHARERALEDAHVPHHPQLLAARLRRRHLLHDPLLLEHLELFLLGLHRRTLDTVRLGRLLGERERLRVELILGASPLLGLLGATLLIARRVHVAVSREEREAHIRLLESAAVVAAVAAHEDASPRALLRHPEHLGLARGCHPCEHLEGGG